MTINYRTWSLGEIVTADMLNAEIRDNGNALVASISDKPLCYLWDASQSCTNNTITEISAWNQTLEDTDGFHSGTNAYMTIPAGMSGYYMVTVYGYWNSHSSAGKRRMVGLDRRSVDNPLSSLYRWVESPNDDQNDYFHQEMTILMHLLAGDTLRAVLLQNSGTSLTFTASQFSIIKVA